MASLINELLEVLKTEEAGYRELIESSTRKQQAIIQANILALEDITGEEEAIAGRIKTAETKREAVMKDIADILNRKSEELTVDKMVEVLKNQPKEQGELITLRASLKKTLAEMKMINEQNQMLVNQAIEMVDFDMALIKSMKQAPETANYNSQAYNTGDLLGGGGFDAKQ